MSDEPQVRRLVDLVSYQSGAAVSRIVVKRDAGNVTLFAFDAGQELSEHRALRRAGPRPRRRSRHRDRRTRVSAPGRRHDRFFDRFAEPMWEPFATMAGGEWAPSLDLSETKDAMVVTAEMPGVDPKEIEIALTGDLLTLKRRSATTASSGPTERSFAASDCRWRWTEARLPRRSRTDYWS